MDLEALETTLLANRLEFRFAVKGKEKIELHSKEHAFSIISHVRWRWEVN
jgi:hypothetical protein